MGSFRSIIPAIIALACWATAVAEDVVSIEATRPYAYESNPTAGYGEFKITRTVDGASLTVYLDVDGTANVNSPPMGTFAFSDYTQDCDLRVVLPAGTVNLADQSTMPSKRVDSGYDTVGAITLGSTSIPLTGGTRVINAGDRVSFTSDPNWYTVATGVAGGNTIVLTTGLAVAQAAPQNLIIESVVPMPARDVTERFRGAVTFAAGQKVIFVRVYAWSEAFDKEPRVELGETVTMRIAADVPNGAPVNYTIAAQSIAAVAVIDGNVTLSTQVDDGVAEEQDPTANIGVPSGGIFGTVGNMRLRFENSALRAVGTIPQMSYSPYADRFVELTRSGDYVGGLVRGTIGGGLVGDRGADDVRIFQPWAVLRVNEYGDLLAATTASIPTAGGAGADPDISEAGSVQAVITGYGGSVTLTEAVAVTSGLGNPAVTTTATPPRTQTGIRVTGVAGGTLSLATAIPTPLAEGATINIYIWRETSETTSVAGVVGVPGDNGVLGAATTVITRSSVITGYTLTVHNSIMYTAPTDPTTATHALGFTSRTTSLFLGDQIVIDGFAYRIIGPTPVRGGPHRSGTWSLQNSQIQFRRETNQSVPIVTDPGFTYMIIYPRLQRPIPREGVAVTTLFPLNFPSTNGGKEVVEVIPMARPVAPFFEHDNHGYPANYPNDLPLGDWMDIELAVANNTTIEGARSFTVTANASTGNNGYDILTPQSGTIIVGDNDATARISKTQDAIEPATAGSGGVPAIFVVSFQGTFPRDIQVPYTIVSDGSTTAVPPTTTNVPPADFTIVGYDAAIQRGTVTLVAGQSYATIRVDPTWNGVPTVPARTMGIQLNSSLDYRLLGQEGNRNNSTATALIYDNLIQGAVALSLDPAATMAGDGRENSIAPVPLSFKVSFLNPVSAETRVYYGIDAASTATAGVDYQIPTASFVTVPLGATQAIITIPVLDDQLIEASETVVVSLAAGAGYTLSEQSQVTGRIVDDEPSVSINSSVAFTAESSIPVAPAGSVVPGQFTVSYPGVPLGTALTRPLVVPYTITGSATAGTDYVSLSGTVTIPANQLSTTIDITPLFDNRIEGAETVVVDLTDAGGPGAGAYDVAVGSASVTINDDTTSFGQTVSVTVPDANAAEADGPIANSGTVLISLNRWLPLTLTGSYTGNETSILLAASSGQQVVLPAGTVIWLPGASVAASDDVPVTVQSQTVVTTAASVPLTAPLPVQVYLAGTCYATNGLGEAVSVMYTTGGTATAGVDYATLPGNLTFEPVTLLAGTHAGAYLAGDLAVSLVTLSGAPVYLPVGAVIRLPGSAASPADDFPVVVTVATSIGSTAQSVSVSTLPAGSGAGAAYMVGLPVTVAVVDDTQVESAQTVNVSVISGAHYTVISTARTGIVTIADDDPTVSIYALIPTVNEPPTPGATPGTGKFVISYPGFPLGTALQRDLVINYTIGGTASEDVDYNSLSSGTPLTGTVTIPRGVLSTILDVTPLYDAQLDPNETVIVTLVDDGGPGAGIYDVVGASATVTITNSLPSLPTVTLAPATSVAAETDGGVPVDGKIKVTLTRQVGNTGPVAVAYDVGGSASAGGDYVALPGTLTFNPMTLSGGPYASGATYLTLSVTDQWPNPFGLPVGAVLTMPSGVIATVVDDPATGTEETVYLIYASASPIPVNLTGMTTSGTCYVSQLPLDVTVLDDQNVEPSETVIVTLATSTAYTLGTPNTLTVTIVDDEPVVWVKATTPVALEPSTVAATDTVPGVFTFSYEKFTLLTLSGGPYMTGATSLTLATTDGASVTLPAGTAIRIPGPLVGTASDDITTTLVNPTALGATPMPVSVVALTGGSVAGSAYAITGPTAPLRRAVTVTLLVSAVTGSATPGTDYVALPATVTIPANAVSVTLPVTPAFDAPIDPGETVNVTMVDDNGAGAGTLDLKPGYEADAVTIGEPPSDIAVAVTTAADGTQGILTGETVTVTASAATVSLNIHNAGTGNLTLPALTPASFSAASGCAPTITTNLTSPVASGGTTVVVIDPHAVSPFANWRFTVTIASNDPDENPFILTVNAPVAQQIQVARGAILIATDSTGVVDLDGTDPASDRIANTTLGSATDIVYTVTNIGTGSLTITAPTFVGLPVNCTASITEPLVGPLAGGASDTMTIRVTPNAAAAGAGWWFRINMATNDLGNLPLVGGVSAAGTFVLTVASPDVADLTPEIEVTRADVVIADNGPDVYVTPVMAQTSVTLTYTIANIGLGALSIPGMAVIPTPENCAAVRQINPSGIILPGASGTLAIQMTPLLAGDWRFSVSLPNTDANEGPMDWTVNGVATPLAVTPGDLGLGGGAGGCGAGAGGALGLVTILLSLSLLGGRSRRRKSE